MKKGYQKPPKHSLIPRAHIHVEHLHVEPPIQRKKRRWSQNQRDAKPVYEKVPYRRPFKFEIPKANRIGYRGKRSGRPSICNLCMCEKGFIFEETEF
jgi:hypothetical protein